MSVSIRWWRIGNEREISVFPLRRLTLPVLKIIQNVKNMFAKCKELVKIVKIVYDACEIFVNYKSLRSDVPGYMGHFYSEDRIPR
jgi:hypothetical protein